MSENLKVNARTNLDEFKRKHNKLVDGMTSKFNVTSITSLSNSQIEELKCGDIVTKEDNTGKHAYVVTFKKDNVGICLTYTDASVVETVSYDKSGNNWVYNSTDVMPLINVEQAQTGTIQNALGLNSSGKLVKGTISGGTQLYKHTIEIDSHGVLIFYNNSNTPLISYPAIRNAVKISPTYQPSGDDEAYLLQEYLSEDEEFYQVAYYSIPHESVQTDTIDFENAFAETITPL